MVLYRVDGPKKIDESTGDKKKTPINIRRRAISGRNRITAGVGDEDTVARINTHGVFVHLIRRNQERYDVGSGRYTLGSTREEKYRHSLRFGS